MKNVENDFIKSITIKDGGVSFRAAFKRENEIHISPGDSVKFYINKTEYHERTIDSVKTNKDGGLTVVTKVTEGRSN